MMIYDAILVLLGLKKETTPTKENWIKYADFKSSHAYRLFSDSNFFLLLAIVMSMLMPIFLFVVFICCYYRFLNRLGKEVDHHLARDYMPYTLVNCIQLKHNQTFKEYLMAEPALIDSVYKKKTLLHWSAHYKNYEAHKLILLLMKERLQRQK
jgi:hypothetical protein